MATLQQIFDDQMSKQFSQEEVVKRAIVNKLSKAGLKLNKRIESAILVQVEAGLAQGKTKFEFDEKGILKLNPQFSNDDISKLDLNVGDTEFQVALDEISRTLSELVPEVVEASASQTYGFLKRSRKADLVANRKYREGFEKRLERKWRSAFDSLEMFVALALEGGDSVNTRVRPLAKKDNDLVFEVLVRLHARACRVAGEVLALIKSGFADGAHARWRTIHEMNIVAMFISEHGSETANRYLLHDAVESLKAARQINEFHKSIGHKKVPAKQLRALQRQVDRLKTNFGNEFGGSYGWAAAALNKSNPNFSDIEKAVGLDHFRPYYKLASHNVHAGPKGVFFSMGLQNDGDDILLAGPSNTGFADPAHGTALALLQITTQVLARYPTVDTLVLASVLKKHVDEIGDRFLSIQLKLEGQ